MAVSTFLALQNPGFLALHPPPILARRFLGQLPRGSPSNPLVILRIFGVGNQILAILSIFYFFGTDFGLQKMDWDNF